MDRLAVAVRRAILTQTISIGFSLLATRIARLFVRLFGLRSLIGFLLGLILLLFQQLLVVFLGQKTVGKAEQLWRGGRAGQRPACLFHVVIDFAISRQIKYLGIPHPAPLEVMAQDVIDFVKHDRRDSLYSPLITNFRVVIKPK